MSTPPERFEISQRFFFDAAHTLERHIESEGSRRIHGHTYHATVCASGPRDPQTGMVIDIGELRLQIESVRARLDHHFLDDVMGGEPATLENLCRFIRQALQPHVPGLCAVIVEREALGDRCELRWQLTEG
jgi:6-pyruvoyltetrahydropterin/6-carboxytetrahydropterin synthase